MLSMPAGVSPWIMWQAWCAHDASVVQLFVRRMSTCHLRRSTDVFTTTSGLIVNLHAEERSGLSDGVLPCLPPVTDSAIAKTEGSNIRLGPKSEAEWT
jgi:hypothetical protein